MTLLEGTENGLDFCPLSVYFLGFLFFFFISKVINFLWDWLVAEKMEEKKWKEIFYISSFGFYVSSTK